MTEELTTKLEATFRNIQVTRMRDVPVLNNKLQVKAINFQDWDNYHLGILVTPWFMNIMLLPMENAELDKSDHYNGKAKTGSSQNHTFPSGSYEFVAGYEEEIGHFQSCSLFSPMFVFENQEAAERTAEEALKAIMNEDNLDTSSQNPTKEIEQIWKGEIPAPEKTHHFDGSKIENTKAQTKKLSERLQEPSSRRDFLRGKAFRAEP